MPYDWTHNDRKVREFQVLLKCFKKCLKLDKYEFASFAFEQSLSPWSQNIPHSGRLIISLPLFESVPSESWQNCKKVL